MAIENILKSLREKSGLSMAKVATSLGIPKGTYASYEYGQREPNIDMIKKLADFYGVSTDYLLGREPAPSPFADLNLSEEDEKEVANKYMSLPPEIRACMLDVLIQLGDAVRQRQASGAEQKKTFTVRTAARSNDGTPITNEIMTEKSYEELRNSPDVDTDL